MSTMDAWGTDTGLITNFDGVVVNAYFGYDARYGGGQNLLMIWEVQTNNPEVPSTHQFFSVGNGWTSADNGLTVSHEQAKDKFNRSTIYGQFIDYVIAAGLGEQLAARGQAADPSVRGKPRDASIWLGSMWHFDEHIVKKMQGKEETTVWPVEFKGFTQATAAPGVPQQQAPQQAPQMAPPQQPMMQGPAMQPQAAAPPMQQGPPPMQTPAMQPVAYPTAPGQPPMQPQPMQPQPGVPQAAPQAAPQQPVASVASLAQFDPNLPGQLVAIAQQAPNQGAFLDAVMAQLPNLITNDTVVAVVADPANFEKLRQGQVQ